jgi:protein-disulfide isomerase
VVKQFPILGPASVEAARVAIAVNMIAPERFAEFHNSMYGLKGRVTAETARGIAASLGIDRELLTQTEKGAGVGAEIAVNADLARKIGITGTPSFVIGESVLAGSIGLDRLREAVTKAETADSVHRR